MPFSRYDPSGTLLEDYRKARISLVVVLAEEQEIWQATGIDIRMAYKAQKLEVIYFPIRDYDVPEPRALEQLLDRIIAQATSGRNLVIHCYAGLGRTGLVAACLAKRVMNLSGERAIQWVRAVLPGAVESADQMNFVLKV